MFLSFFFGGGGGWLLCKGTRKPKKGINIEAPFVGVGYFDKGTLSPKKRERKGHH